MTLHLDDGDVRLYHGDVLDELRAMETGSVDCVVTSPPYLDARPEYPSPTVEEFGAIFAELGRVCTGPALVNVGRLFRGGAESLWWVSLIHAAKEWRLLDTVVWVKPNANPIHGNVFANRHEYVLVLGVPFITKLNVDAVRVPYAPSSIARLKRGWRNHVGVKGELDRKKGRLTTDPNPDGARAPSFVVVDVGREKGNTHPAPMPVDLAMELISVASWPGQIVLDPFVGSGTTAVAARRLERQCVGIDRDADYLAIAAGRLQQLSLLGDAS